MHKKRKLRNLTSFLLTAAFFLSALPVTARETGLENSSEYTEPFPYIPMFSLPDNMRGTIISPETDFFTSPDNSLEDIIVQLDKIYNEIENIGLNTVIIKTAASGQAYYDLDMNGGGKDPVSVALRRAQSRFFRVYLVYDIMPVLESSYSKSDAVNSLISEAHRFAIKYPCDGIILDSYYSDNTPFAFGEYMRKGSGIGFDNWLFDSTEYYFETVSSIMRATDNTIPIGIMINDSWANSNSAEGGSPTQDSVEALFDGYADTKKYIESGYADFALVRAYGSLDDTRLPFKESSEWWGELCAEADIPMYIIHYNEKIGTIYAGWGSEDQLLRQLSTAKDIAAYGGSAFNSYSSLSANPLNTTTKIKQYYDEKIKESALFNELKMSSPKELNFTTYEPVVAFAGSFDENFDVYWGGDRITLNEAGRFYFEEELSIGMNTYTIKHKDKTYTYKIERKIITMRELAASIAEGKTLRVDGGTSVNIEAVAYKGAEVVATVNGQTIKLKQRSTVSQNEDANTSYVSYTGKYIAPEGIEEQEQALGKITVQASYMGQTKMLEGASIIVNAKPKPPEVIPEIEMYDQDSLGSGETVGTIGAVRSENETVRLVKVNANNTHVLNAKDTGTVYTPEFGQLPAGTVDYFKADVGGFYTTESGKRFFAKDVTLIDGAGLGENTLSVISTGTRSGDSYFRIKLDKRISYRIETADLKYYSEWGGDFNISSFSASYIYITFDNVTSVTKLPDFETNRVFSAGSWEQVTIGGVPKFRLVLKLRQPGVYMGNNAYYNSDGELMLTFPVMQSNLSALTVVIDPGHGYGKENASTYDPGSIGHVIEQEVNVQIAEALTKKLREQGVNTIRLETEKTHYLTVLRPVVARAYGCDIFLSIHSNRVSGKDDVRGTEVYYFTPFSQPLAAAISSRVSSYFTNNVYADGADKNRGAKNLDFWVTLQQDFPSVLIETGFVSNIEDAMALANSTHQAGIADAIVSGIKDYVSRSNISYSTDGSADIPNGGDTFAPEIPVTQEPAESTNPPETSQTSGEESEPDSIEIPDNTEYTDFDEMDFLEENETIDEIEA